MSLKTKKSIIKNKGKNCSKLGNAYEKKIYNVVKDLYINKKRFNLQEEKDLGGSNNRNDLICNFNSIKDIGIEIKKKQSPDWVQCCITYENGRWISKRNKNKIPSTCKDIFDELLKDISLYEDKIPFFIENKITHDELLKIKKKSDMYRDVYLDIPNDIIKKLYREKGYFLNCLFF